MALALAMLPFASGGCAVDPCPRINARMQMLTSDMVANPDLFQSEEAGMEAQRLAIDSVRYGCLTR